MRPSSVRRRHSASSSARGSAPKYTMSTTQLGGRPRALASSSVRHAYGNELYLLATLSPYWSSDVDEFFVRVYAQIIVVIVDGIRPIWPLIRLKWPCSLAVLLSVRLAKNWAHLLYKPTVEASPAGI